MSSLLKTKKLKKLKELWDRKLAKSGLEDIEDGHPEEPLLIRWHSSDFKRARVRHTFHAKQEYFVQAEHFLNEYKFQNKRERRIWELHSKGLSLREIAKLVRANKDSTVHKVIKRLRNEMLYGNNNN